jgi:cell division protein FtsI (penicillin-binding protein 3)
VLALANYPSYSPNNRQNLTGEQLRNRAITDTFEPGSTMKPFTIGLALESGLVTPQTPIQTAPGYVVIGGARISDSHAHGMLTVQQVIQKSSNIGTLKIALQMQPRDMWETFTAAGFGQKPQISFPGAVSGRLRPFKTWRPVEQATMSYGYGLSASLFQMARSYTVFAHDGQIIPATLLKSDAAGGRACRCSRPRRRPRSAPCCRWRRAPAAPAPRRRPGLLGRRQVRHRAQAGGKSYASNKYRSWFVGMAPIDKPRIIVAVMLDEPSAGKYFGGDVAAPVFSTVVQQTLRQMNVQPDMSVKPQVWSTPWRSRSDAAAAHAPEDAARWLKARVRGGLHCDSRRVRAGDGFIAWPGAATDGRKHVPARCAGRDGLPGGAGRRRGVRLRRTRPSRPTRS